MSEVSDSAIRTITANTERLEKLLQEDEQEIKDWQTIAEGRFQRIAELESILRDIVADADTDRARAGYPVVTWASINRAKRLLKIAPFDK